MGDNLRSKAVQGISWSFAGQMVKQSFQFVFNVILARLLSPAEFGLVAMANVFVYFLLIFSDLGISSALIQKKNVTESHWSSAFWLNFALGLILTVLFVFLSPAIAHFYNHPELENILMVLSVNFVLSSLTMIQQSILTRNLDFYALMVRDIGSVVISGLLAIYLAFKGWGVWSLVIQLLIATTVNNIFLWCSSQWRPKFIFSLTAIKDFFSFSSNLTCFQTLNYFARNLDQLLIGKFLGSQELGYYSLAYKLMMLPLQNISWVLVKVMFPVFSKVQDDKVRLGRAFLKMLKAISIISFPIMMLFFALGPELIRTVYGPKWSLAGDIVRILSFCGMFQSVGTIAGLVYQSIGKTDLQLRMGILDTAITFLTLFFCVRYGLFGVALGYTTMSILWVHVTLGVGAWAIGMRYKTMYSALGIANLIVCVFLVLTFIIKRFIVLPDISLIALVGVVFSFAFIVMLFITGELSFQNKRLKIALLS